MNVLGWGMSNSKTILYPGTRIHIVYTREFPLPPPPPPPPLPGRSGENWKDLSAGGSHRKKTSRTRAHKAVPMVTSSGLHPSICLAHIQCKELQTVHSPIPRAFNRKSIYVAKFGAAHFCNTTPLILSLGRHELTVRTSCMRMASAQLTGLLCGLWLSPVT